MQKRSMPSTSTDSPPRDERPGSAVARGAVGPRWPLRQLVLVLGLLCGVLLSACQRPAPLGSDVVVEIAGEPISYAKFETYLRSNVQAERALDDVVLSRLFDQFLDGELLNRLAVERGLLDPQATARQAIAFLLRSLPQEPWDPATIQQYYEVHAQEFELPERVHLRQILVPEEAQARAVRDALAAGDNFAQVAARFSQEPKASLGGDQGWFAVADLPPAFAETIDRLRPGEISNVLSADYGYHIFQVVDRAPARRIPLAEAADEIRQTLERRRIDEQVTQWIHEGRGRYPVEIHRSNFPFTYEGEYAQQNHS